MNVRFACLGLVLALFAGGCAYRTPPIAVPSNLEAGAEVASSITITNWPDEATRAALITETADLLSEAHARGVVRAEVIVEAEEDHLASAMHKDGMAAFAASGIPFGLVYEREKIAVELQVDANGHTYRGHGEADKNGGIYAHARRRALAAALAGALAQASRDTTE